ncbi:hypothetical protein VTJ83DRAFT_648 [Remersonia thermophila]|uniref:N-acetyltransferase domain-containing protein n=1 Tax=Remersonia thermophila TaxID=72144 RepID=A0ABR4DNB7_9PEZI
MPPSNAASPGPAGLDPNPPPASPGPQTSASPTAAAAAAAPPPPSQEPTPPELNPANPFPAPTLVLTKSVLRPIHVSDAPALQRAADSPRVARFLSYQFVSPYTLRDALGWVVYALRFRVAGHPDVVPSLCICDPATNAMLGGIGVKDKGDVEKGCLEIGYWIGEESWGKGIMSEACRAYVRWLFQVYPDVRRVEATVFSGNHASSKVLDKAGFVYEGTKRKAVMKHGEVHDLLIYGLLREECEPLE